MVTAVTYTINNEYRFPGEPCLNTHAIAVERRQSHGQDTYVRNNNPSNTSHQLF